MIGRLLIFAIALASPIPALAADIVGRGVVIDGDTIDIGTQRVRLWGIDAPERRQTCTERTGEAWRCGLDAKAALSRLTAGKTVRCTPRYRDRDGRQVASCLVDATDLGRTLVRQGWALDYPHFSKGEFPAQEQQARRARVGVWRGQIIPPWQWRSQHEVRTEREQQEDRRCRIKGNINAEGQRIAHAPGQRDYATVRIHAARGEQWFCTMPAARAAGWRPAER